MELGHNYNIQCMKLFQELKGAFPATPDEVVRQCMKSVSSNCTDLYMRMHEVTILYTEIQRIQR